MRGLKPVPGYLHRRPGQGRTKANRAFGSGPVEILDNRSDPPIQQCKERKEFMANPLNPLVLCSLCSLAATLQLILRWNRQYNSPRKFEHEVRGYSLGRVSLPRCCGVEPSVGFGPTRGVLSTYFPQPSGHPMLADPAARLIGPVVILASPNVHRVCQSPTLSAFTGHEAVRLPGCLILTGLIG